METIIAEYDDLRGVLKIKNGTWRVIFTNGEYYLEHSRRNGERSKMTKEEAEKFITEKKQ